MDNNPLPASSTDADWEPNQSETPKMDLLGLVDGVMSENVAIQIKATTQFRKFVSLERNAPISQVIVSGVVPKFVEFLDRFDVPQLQLEAAWILTNIASGTPDETNVVIDLGAVPKLVKLLTSPNNDLCDQAIWALGNIGSSDRDVVLRHGILPPLLQMLNEPTTTIRLRNGAWALSNLYRSKPHPEFNVVRQALPTLARLVSSNDEEVIADVCWALAELSQGDNEHTQAILDLDVIPHIVELLKHRSTNVKMPALLIIGNIATGNTSQTQVVINASVLPCLFDLLTHRQRTIRKQSCKTISNITTGTKDQIQAVIDAGIFPLLVHILSNAEFELRKEAICAMNNATTSATPVQIEHLVQCGAIRPLCDLLVVSEIRTLELALRGIENFLFAGEALRLQNHLEVNPYIKFVRDVEGLGKLQSLQNHATKNIREHTQSILEICNHRGDLDDEAKNTSHN